MFADKQKFTYISSVGTFVYFKFCLALFVGTEHFCFVFFFINKVKKDGSLMFIYLRVCMCDLKIKVATSLVISVSAY